MMGYQCLVHLNGMDVLWTIRWYSLGPSTLWAVSLLEEREVWQQIVFSRLCFLTSVDFCRLSGLRHTGSAGLDHSCVNQWRYSIARTAATSCRHMHSDSQGTLLYMVVCASHSCIRFWVSIYLSFFYSATIPSVQVSLKNLEVWQL